MLLKLCSCQNHLSHRLLGPTPEFLFQWVWSEVQECALLTSFQVMTVLYSGDPTLRSADLRLCASVKCLQRSSYACACVNSSLSATDGEGVCYVGHFCTKHCTLAKTSILLHPGQLLQPTLTQKQRSLRFV